MAALHRKVGWVGDESRVIFSQKLPGEKGNVSRCVIVMQQPVVLSPKFWANFNAVAVKSDIRMRN
jgi:hypothetical protein